MKYIRVREGRYHADPPLNRCGVMSQTKEIVPWEFANNLPGFDPIAWGREALACKELVKPCLHCFPECKQSEDRLRSECAEKLADIMEQHLDSLPVTEKQRIVEKVMNREKRERN